MLMLKMKLTVLLLASLLVIIAAKKHGRHHDDSNNGVDSDEGHDRKGRALNYTEAEGQRKRRQAIVKGRVGEVDGGGPVRRVSRALNYTGAEGARFKRALNFT